MQTVSDIGNGFLRLRRKSMRFWALAVCRYAQGVQNTCCCKASFGGRAGRSASRYQLYSYQEQITNSAVTVGLDEVGRGRWLAPLTVGAVVLRKDAPPPIERAQRFETGV